MQQSTKNDRNRDFSKIHARHKNTISSCCIPRLNFGSQHLSGSNQTTDNHDTYRDGKLKKTNRIRCNFSADKTYEVATPHPKFTSFVLHFRNSTPKPSWNALQIDCSKKILSVGDRSLKASTNALKGFKTRSIRSKAVGERCVVYNIRCYDHVRMEVKSFSRLVVQPI